ncbi:quinone oxidoreductase family protein [Brevibacterium sediminis]|uniref:quinone oxidoreductase family protein n=1 Tax=Brevibacterium sediminis TaxID=1857024 RepID=UPI003B3A8777
MKAAIIERFGEAPALRELPELHAGDGEAVVRVRAAAIKNIERMLSVGTHYASTQMTLPSPLGLDAVVNLPDGRRAFAGARPPGGAMAERMIIDPSTAILLPDDVDDASAAALPNAGVSARIALEHSARLQPGQSVLVLGGTGVTGALAVQLAKHKFQAGHVVAVGRNRERLAELRRHSTDCTIRLPIDPGQLNAAIAEAHKQRPFDVVLDFLWGMPAEQTLHALAGNDLSAGYHRTRYVQVGEMAGPDLALPASNLRSAGIELVGQGGGSVPKEVYARVPDIVRELFEMLAAGELAINTISRPLAEVTQAWNQSVPSGTRVVLKP